ncbi:HlyU family transcriptional regulator [Marinomonas algarum]|uniref:Transcriptional regulator n=1 Tax=Marinomonas algarum TaxID=2883105 RepID=A0A9X1LEY5_9GAMM|nr:HlyU family transcriptional regulator [Marinomonas algarum]MCB5162281.1 transcriptional regulator [Marinomonas algarum]
MGILSGLKGLFSGSETTPEPAEEAVEYKGFSIVPAPIKDAGQFRVAATITKGQDDTLQTHNFIRSDLIGSHSQCVEITLRKAKLTIDQLGEAIFQ